MSELKSVRQPRLRQLYLVVGVVSFCAGPGGAGGGAEGDPIVVLSLVVVQH